jgi:hypothetical protein
MHWVYYSNYYIFPEFKNKTINKTKKKLKIKFPEPPTGVWGTVGFEWFGIVLPKFPE